MDSIISFVKQNISRFSALLTLCASSSLLAGSRYFDDVPYELSPSFKTPMDTLAALTDWGQSINHVYGITTLILVFVFLTVSLPLIYIMRRFRVRDDDNYQDLPVPKQVHGNAKLELLWTIIPCILLIFIAIPTWESIFKFSSTPPKDALRVTVIGHQWWFEFQYPDLGITTASELHIPENTPVHLTLTSADVIHSFWIPQFGGKLDMLPGKDAENTLFFTSPSLKNKTNPIKGGEYYQGQCAELCGESHALMRFFGVVHSKDEFERWAAVYNEPPKVMTKLQKKGEEVFATCGACHTIAGTASEEQEKQMLAMDPPLPKIGPNLTDFGSRRSVAGGTRLNTEANVVEWIKNPEYMKPGSLMKALGLSDEDTKAVAAYIRFATAKRY